MYHEFHHPKFELQNPTEPLHDTRSHNDEEYDRDGYNDDDEYKRGHYKGDFHGGGEYHDDPMSDIEKVENERVFPELTGPPSLDDDHDEKTVYHHNEQSHHQRAEHGKLPEYHQTHRDTSRYHDTRDRNEPLQHHHETSAPQELPYDHNVAAPPQENEVPSHQMQSKPDMIISPEDLKNHMQALAGDHNPTTNNDIPLSNIKYNERQHQSESDNLSSHLMAGLPDLNQINTLHPSASNFAGKTGEETKPLSEKAEVLLNQMQEIALRNQRLLDSPESPLNGNTRPRNGPLKDLSTALPDPSAQSDPLPVGKSLSAALPDPSYIDPPPEAKITGPSKTVDVMQFKDYASSLPDPSQVDPPPSVIPNEGRFSGRKNEIQSANMNNIFFIKPVKKKEEVHTEKGSHEGSKIKKRIKASRNTSKKKHQNLQTIRNAKNSTKYSNHTSLSTMKKTFIKKNKKAHKKNYLTNNPTDNINFHLKSQKLLKADRVTLFHNALCRNKCSRIFFRKGEKRNGINNMFNNKNVLTIQRFYHPRQFHKEVEIATQKTKNENRKELLLNNFFVRHDGKG